MKLHAIDGLIAALTVVKETNQTPVSHPVAETDIGPGFVVTIGRATEFKLELELNAIVAGRQRDAVTRHFEGMEFDIPLARAISFNMLARQLADQTGCLVVIINIQGGAMTVSKSNVTILRPQVELETNLVTSTIAWLRRRLSDGGAGWIWRRGTSRTWLRRRVVNCFTGIPPSPDPAKPAAITGLGRWFGQRDQAFLTGITDGPEDKSSKSLPDGQLVAIDHYHRRRTWHGLG